jgi:histone deacetylase complex regulatory component SIN3
VWFSPTERKGRTLHDLLFAVSALSNSPASEDQLDDTTRPSKRAKLAPVEEDAYVFKNVRLSHDDFQVEPFEAPDSPNPFDNDVLDPLGTTNPSSHDAPDHAPEYRNRNLHANNPLNSTLESDTKATPPPAAPFEQVSNAISGFGIKPPVEFNHAISFVDKVKYRFYDQPDIYEQFLKILVNYERESTPIQDVYAQVIHLFNSAHDLIEDFKQFIPTESIPQVEAQAARIPLAYPNGEGKMKRKRP